MSTEPNPRSFENLQHNALYTLQSREDKNIRLTIGTYNGRTTLNVFTGQGGRPWNTRLSRPVVMRICRLLELLKSNGEPIRYSITLTDWDRDTKKHVKTADLGFGIDDSRAFVIDVAPVGQKKFVLAARDPFGVDFTNTPLTERDNTNAQIDEFIDVIKNIAPIREALTSFKLPQQNGGGFNRGGGGGNYNRGGGQGGGNYNRSNGGGNSGGGSSGGNRGFSQEEDDVEDYVV
jgi:uncharacterized membrane protein YgcG